LLINELLIK